MTAQFKDINQNSTIIKDIEESDIENAVKKAKIMMKKADCYVESVAMIEALDYYERKLSNQTNQKSSDIKDQLNEQDVTLNQIDAEGAQQ